MTKYTYDNVNSTAIDNIKIDVENQTFRVKYVKRSRDFYEYHCPFPEDVAFFINHIIESNQSLGQAVYYLIKINAIISKEFI